MLGLACVLAVGIGTPVTGLARFEHDLAEADDDDEGRAPHPEELVPSVEAAFRSESYAPGAVASLRTFNAAHGVRMRIFRVGPEREHTVGNNEMRGVPVSPSYSIGTTRAGRIVRLRVGNWPSGLYFARLAARDGRVGFAPFVVRPRTLGEHRVAVVLPTQTWQAYNIRDDDRDGKGGHSWYADWRFPSARLHRPFLNRGVPPNFRSYDLRFLHWLVDRRKQVDVLADCDLDTAPSADEFARAYDLIVFPGHHEYVTQREYDVVEGYRDRGGNVMFLSANNFFWKVVKRGDDMRRIRMWRDIGRPEASLIGVQYTSNMGKFGKYVVLDTKTEPWVWAGTGLRKGSVFGNGGIEIDAISSYSPRNVTVLARIPNVFGPGRNADMTIYRTKSGGMVFAAGSFTLADQVVFPVGGRIVENVWSRMTREP